jgi:Glu-tRNA(Gln) amidotransferase subunit E-like FAD-binding protein
MASILDVKRNKQDFLKHKSKSSGNTLVNYTFIFKSIEKFCISKYDSSLENIIEELSIVENPQEQVENLIQNYIDELETEGKAHSTVSCYSCIAKNYLKYRRVKFDKDELETCLNCGKIKRDYKCVKYSCGSVYCVKCDNKLKE